MSERDLHAEFERIIAGWDDEAPDPQLHDGTPDGAAGRAKDADTAPDTEPAPAPADDATDAVDRALDQPPDRTSDPTASPGQPGQAGMTGQSGASGLLELPIAPTTPHAWRGSTPQRDDADEILDAVEPDRDHFVPPSEIDLPSAETDPMYWAIVGGLAGGPLLLLYLLFFDRDGSGWWVVTALTMIVVGFVLLVLRGGTERDPFDDGTRV